MLKPLPLVKPLKVKFNLHELQALHFLQNYGYIINNQKEAIIATNTALEAYINMASWWADFISACRKINYAYAFAIAKQKNASVIFNYSEAAAVYKVMMRINWELEDNYAQMVAYSFIGNLNKYLC